jgi:hypothetical protein
MRPYRGGRRPAEGRPCLRRRTGRPPCGTAGRHVAERSSALVFLLWRCRAPQGDSLDWGQWAIVGNDPAFNGEGSHDTGESAGRSRQAPLAPTLAALQLRWSLVPSQRQ